MFIVIKLENKRGFYFSYFAYRSVRLSAWNSVWWNSLRRAFGFVRRWNCQFAA
ncbi:hypothetical protein MAR_019397 [Mya arenaria]|uniref:Uncharacterized protein n=1 Tax=Mya arenaria TaxID=6604 RepID=A0ABY7EM28_MYAAR|nr:hypothetical protein MAR_019397 [Mya arenaria]